MTQPQPIKVHPERQRRVRIALNFFSVTAWATGVMLLALCTRMVFDYLTPVEIPQWAEYIGRVHGWVYMVFVISSFMLGLRARWEPKVWVITALCGVVPFLSFYVEKKRREEVVKRFQLDSMPA
ncbi:DUF3817 domain-containing protein [Corynebacterium lowii]|uniref:DUF3817 domain-containing protein n=1 Tax=Corynebacterium lowii TaxID=1544413 RepID=A0A0Q0YQX5_9CORY|nr:DUF3817 domain-containing protein [Corynebacterium lowii]KQB84827.1 hypothetical protein Clow_02089 [Corynebacterium lowii]MDP9851731.1 integral membrane protein [Corynebacterium lowii]